MDDVDTGCQRPVMCGAYVVDEDRHVWIDGGTGICIHQTQLMAEIIGERNDPAVVHDYFQLEDLAVLSRGLVDIRDGEVRHDALDAHRGSQRSR